MVGETGKGVTQINLNFSCPPESGCTVQAGVSTTTTTKGSSVVGVSASRAGAARSLRRHIVVVARASETVGAGLHGTLKLVLNAVGRRLLARFRRLPSILKMTQAVGGRNHLVLDRHLTLKPPRRRRR